MRRKCFVTVLEMVFIVMMMVLVVGCNPATTAVKLGVHMVGKVVADEQTVKSTT